LKKLGSPAEGGEDDLVLINGMHSAPVSI
jgi:hypothetical protein